MLDYKQVEIFRKISRVTSKNATYENVTELRQLLEELDETSMEKLLHLTSHDWAALTIASKIKSLHDVQAKIIYEASAPVHPSVQRERRIRAQRKNIERARENGLTMAEQALYDKCCDGSLQWARVRYKIMARKNAVLKNNLKVAIDFVKEDKPTKSRVEVEHSWFGRKEILVLVGDKHEIFVMDSRVLIVRLSDSHEWCVENGTLIDETARKEQQDREYDRKFKEELRKALAEDRHDYSVEQEERSDAYGDHRQEYMYFRGWYHGHFVDVTFVTFDEDGENHGWEGEIDNLEIPHDTWTKEFLEEYGYDDPEDTSEFEEFVVKHLPR